MKFDVNKLTDEESGKILKILSNNDKEIKSRIKSIYEDINTNTDYKKIAEELFDQLNSIDLQDDVWSKSGKSSHGYQDPYEVAYEVFREVVDEFIEKAQKLLDFKMILECKNTIKGILVGLNQFESEGSDLTDWIPDAISEVSEELMNKWTPIFGADFKKEIEEILVEE